MAVIKTVLYEFRLGDVEDPEIYAAQPLWEWQQTESGQWCMDRCTEAPEYQVIIDRDHYGYRIAVTGKFEEQDYTFWKLKYGK